jgi:lipopolysaccharide export system ATP-binding protein
MLVVKELSHSFRKIQVLKKVSLEVCPGEVIGLLGPNGAGKTTAFNLIAGLLPVQRGSIFWNHERIVRWSVVRRAKHGMIYLPQEPSVFSQLTVKQNIVSILEFHPHLFRDREAILQDVSQKLQIETLLERPAGVLSGGERRRLEIARALALKPSLLLLDEPFSGIDPIAVSEIKDIIRSLAHLGIGILVTDHNVRETLKVCSRAYILSHGTMICSGSPEAISHDEKAKRFYLGNEFEL